MLKHYHKIFNYLYFNIIFYSNLFLGFKIDTGLTLWMKRPRIALKSIKTSVAVPEQKHCSNLSASQIPNCTKKVYKEKQFALITAITRIETWINSISVQGKGEVPYIHWMPLWVLHRTSINLYTSFQQNQILNKISYIHKRVGGLVLHYRDNYVSEHSYTYVNIYRKKRNLVKLAGEERSVVVPLRGRRAWRRYCIHGEWRSKQRKKTLWKFGDGDAAIQDSNFQIWGNGSVRGETGRLKKLTPVSF